MGQKGFFHTDPINVCKWLYSRQTAAGVSMFCMFKIQK